MSRHPALECRQQLLALLEQWSRRGWLRELDRSLALFLAGRDAGAQPLLLLASALASQQLGQGHVCLDLRATLEQPDFSLALPPEGDAGELALLPSQLLAGVSLADWQAACSGSLLLQGEGAPLVLDGVRLYLRRYHDYELSVAAALRQRLDSPAEAPADLARRLAELFPEPLRDAAGQRLSDWQKLACALAARGRFTLITGGPGTGKTTTVVRLLAMLQQAALTRGQLLRLSLAAPTGKAAARLTESIAAQVSGLPVDERVRAGIPAEVTTLHRLLGSLPDSRNFRHHAGNLLALDVLVVDEASMIDLEMMARLLAALPAHARLILLGDKDQLASVEAGAVLGELCRDAEQGGYSPATRHWLEANSGESLALSGLREGSQQLDQQVVMLRHSRRFSGDSGIGQLARAVNAGDPLAARRILAGDAAAVQGVRLSGEQDTRLLRLLLEGRAEPGLPLPGHAAYLQLLHQRRPAADAEPAEWAEWARAVLDAFACFQLLCAVRKGPFGVEAQNQAVAGALHRAGLLEAEQGWYEGRPVLVTRNDYSLGLMNGDIGIALRLPDAQAEGGCLLRVAFPRNDGGAGLRYLLPSRLSAVETVYAMTVHKSQGSEFDHCALLLPDQLNPVLTRELIYTGITRARLGFSLLETRGGLFEEAVLRRVSRRSGLRERLADDG